MFYSIIFYSIVVGASALFYRWLFQGKTDPSISRRIIWDILCFSFILIPFNILFLRSGSHNAIIAKIPTIIIFIYAIGVAVLSVIYLVNFLTLLNIKRNSKKCSVCNTNFFVHTNAQLGCFSWLNNIYLPKNYKLWNEKEVKMIISHENAHIHYGHWLDLKLIRVLCIFQWFNPAIWYLKKELQRVHEYEADFHIIKNAAENKTFYQYFLLKESTGKTLGGGVHSFNSKFLRKRILMMNHKNLKKDWVERASIIFIFGILIAIFF